MTIADEIKDSFKMGSSLTKLIYINLGAFIIIKLFELIGFLSMNSGIYETLINWLAVPAYIPKLITRPWTIITYQFLHEGFLHILFNLLVLFWFGKIFLQFLDGKKLLNVYLLGGISGAVVYILAYNLFPVFEPSLIMSNARGASAAVMAVVIAIAVYSPDLSLHLMFIGPVKLKYIALFYVVLDILSIATANAGGHIAHLGGAAFGYLYIVQYKKGNDISKGFGKLMDGLFSLFSEKKKMKVTFKKPVDDYEYNRRKVIEQAEIDHILDKISKSGYNSLSKHEKEVLFKESGGKR